ncbi:hypothetical protein SAMN05421767_1466 [Granulicatella balaenopterae]|uniref:Transposase for insertion sequence element IS21-like C-terminal domain-containing protein n=2 Tax=Granulicatella balaenopterae TaxID=137733 RepID=A0A1H9NUG2_9LACT|nr:hypothetical protein SAMN05421767_1466 [Granulicatella balaenopterae]
MDELNRKLKKDVDEWCSKEHGTTRRIPNQHYLLEEKETLLPLPKKHYYITALETRKVSNDSYISIKGNKYSVPVQYVTKNVFFRIIYGFKIMIYDSKNNFITSHELVDGKKEIVTIEQHYEAIAPKISTSIPQLKRDFSFIFSNGAEFIEKASRNIQQPMKLMRKIMMLRELYDDNTLDLLLRKAIDEGNLDIKSFQSMLFHYNQQLKLPKEAPEQNKEIDINNGLSDEITRECSYYENSVKGLN